ncbi:hypothetical protein B0H13DRAFT_2654614 [Mycena leptocephala]|nr:hypothetical protein B0H13DRAFT_2654614 [Mycena leptocephala]
MPNDFSLFSSTNSLDECYTFLLFLSPTSSAGSAAQSASLVKNASNSSDVSIDSAPSQSASASQSASDSASASIHSVDSASVSKSAESQSQAVSESKSVQSSSAASSASVSASAASQSSQSASSASVTLFTNTSSVTSALDQSQTGSVTDFLSSNSTASFTTFTTEINGQLTTARAILLVTSALPTSLATAGSADRIAQRTAVIAGATAAGVGLILLLLGALFVYKRHKSRKREFSEAIGRVRREAHGAGGVGLLDDEGFEDDDGVPMRRYQDNIASHSRGSTTTLGPPQSPAPSLFRQRAETGSLFREEGVWPPPQAPQFVDPLVGVGTNDLSKIVDDVMGPAASSSLYNDPFRDMSHAPAPSDPSLYYDRRGASSSMSSHSQQTSGSRPSTPQSLLGLPAGAATPKKPSPLANAATPPSAATWLNRSPRKHTRGLSGSQSSAEG